MAVLTVGLIGVTAFSLTNHQRATGHGCIDFNYATMIGGAEMYRCGAPARALCASRPSRASIDGDFEAELRIACREGRILTSRTGSPPRAHA